MAHCPFCRIARVANFQNVRTLITDDLDHLVISPRSICNDGKEIHDKFDFGGRTLTRAEYFLCAIGRSRRWAW